MTDRPILFSAPMVRALLDGRKAQTRRVLKVDPITARVMLEGGREANGGYPYPSPLRFAVGDRLWVREAWRANGVLDAVKPRDLPSTAWVQLEADTPPHSLWEGRLRPGIHMPRWASRLTLQVTEVRVQRLQDISAEDAVAEGALSDGRVDQFAHVHAIPMYRAIWTDINGPGSWEANPWVVAVTFTVEKINIDQARAAA